MKQYYRILFLILTGIISSCASTLNPRYQKVVIHTNHEANKVYIDDSLVGSGATVHTKLERDVLAKEIRIERDGYESKTYAVIQTKRSPLYILSVIPFAITVYAPVFDRMPNSYNYPGKLPEFKHGVEFLQRDTGYKNILLNTVQLNLTEGDYLEYYIKYRHFNRGDSTPVHDYSNKTSIHELNNSDEFIKQSLNKFLHERGFGDTTKHLLQSANNDLFIDVEVTKWYNYNVYRSFILSQKPSYVFGEVEFKWTLRNAYKKILCEKTISTGSDEFRSYYLRYRQSWADQSELDPTLKMMADAMEKSLSSFLRSDIVKGHLLKDTGEEPMEAIVLSLGEALPVSKLSEAVKACVSIRDGNRHGSGFYVSDQYIISNYHVVGGADTVIVKTSDGIETEGVVVRRSSKYDLVIIETKTHRSTFCFRVDTAQKATLGEVVFAIGTPNSIELTQSISKGIVSGRRVNEETDLIQTDVAINPGSSGGPLVDTRGTLLGVINAKITGENVTGIGFAIPAEKLVSYLNLKF